MEKYKKSEMVTAIAEHTGFTKRDSEKFIDAFCAVLGSVLREGKDVSLLGVGIFKPRMCKEATFQVFGTGNSVTKPAHMKLRFSVAKEIKEFYEEQAGI